AAVFTEVRVLSIVESPVVIAEANARAQVEAFVEVIGALHGLARRLRAQIDLRRRCGGRLLGFDELNRRWSVPRWRRRGRGWRSRWWSGRGSRRWSGRRCRWRRSLLCECACRVTTEAKEWQNQKLRFHSFLVPKTEPPSSASSRIWCPRLGRVGGRIHSLRE